MREIIFFSTVPGLSDAFPILPATKAMPQWMKTAQSKFMEAKENANGMRFSHITRCPGIVEIMTKGYVVPMWHDVMVETDFRKGPGFGWTVPTSTLAEELMKEKNLLGTHSSDGVMEFIPRTHNQSKIFMKINTPWHIVTPKDVKVLFLPISYPDDSMYESTTGILDTKITTEINVQGWWNLLNGRHLLPAGYPLMQILPLTDETFKLTVRDANESDQEWLKKRKYFNSFSFGPLKGSLKNIIKNAYIKHFSS